MSNWSTNVPNPGSREARERGCICPVMDNGYGRGWMGGVEDPETGSVMFVMVEGCPLHWQPDEPSEERVP